MRKYTDNELKKMSKEELLQLFKKAEEECDYWGEKLRELHNCTDEERLKEIFKETRKLPR